MGRYERRSDRLPFAAGDTVLLYTDGLVERRDEDLDTGIGRLAAVVAEADQEGRAHLETFLKAVTGQMRPAERPRHDDDVAVVAVRRLD